MRTQINLGIPHKLIITVLTVISIASCATSGQGNNGAAWAYMLNEMAKQDRYELERVNRQNKNIIYLQDNTVNRNLYPYPYPYTSGTNQFGGF